MKAMEAIKARLLTIWRDPVASGLIGAAILAIGSWVLSRIPVVGEWLLDSAPLPRLALLMLSVVALIGVLAAIRMRTLGARLATLEEQLKSLQAAPQVQPATLAGPVLESADYAILKALSKQEDGRATTGILSRELGFTMLRTHLGCERLQQHAFVYSAGSGGLSDGVFYEMNTAGREEAHRRGWI